jgi:hypothetical protein
LIDIFQALRCTDTRHLKRVIADHATAPVSGAGRMLEGWRKIYKKAGRALGAEPAFSKPRDAKSVELNVVFDIRRHQTDDLARESDDLSGLVPILAKISVNRLREDLQGLLTVWNRSGNGITCDGCRVRNHLSHSYLLPGGRAQTKHGACQHGFGAK